jgi:hypothetical protein
MKTSKYLLKKNQSLIDYRNVQNKAFELTHPKLEITITLDTSGNRKTPHLLLLQMYSKENEVLFI